MSFALKDARVEKDIFAKRAYLAGLFVFLLVCALAARMTFLQITQYDLYATYVLPLS